MRKYLLPPPAIAGAPMSDAKSTDKSDLPKTSPEILALKSKDTHEARNAGVTDITAAEKTRTNQSDGSLRDRAHRISEQDESIEISYGDQSSSRANKVTEKELLANSRKGNSEPLFPGEQQDLDRQSLRDQTTRMSLDTKALLLNREPVQVTASQEQASVHELLSPKPLQGQVSETHEKQPGKPLTNTFGGWSEAGQMLAQMPLDKQMLVIGAGLTAGMDQYMTVERERSWGRLIGTVEGVGEVFTNLATIADFGGAILFNDEKVAGRIGEQFGLALGQTTFDGIRAFATSDKYLFDLGYTGDYVKPFRQIAAAGAALNEQWNDLPPREQERIKYKLITELSADALLGAGGGPAIGKAKKFTEVLDAVAEQTAKHGKQALDSSKRTAGAIADSIDQVIGPKYSYAGIGKIERMAAPADEALDIFAMERRVYVSKLDPTHRLRPIEAARENSRLKGQDFDQDTWKKLKPEEKADELIKDGYSMLENPEPRLPIDSSELEVAFRGDRNLYSPFDADGISKSHINEAGDLLPANANGTYKGKAVQIIEHILSQSPGVKGNSPFTSVGTNGVVFKYGDGQGLMVDIKSLRQAIQANRVHGVEIIEHRFLVESIQQSAKSSFEKKMALRFAGKDNEFLIKGIVPKEFLKVIGEK